MHLFRAFLPVALLFLATSQADAQSPWQKSGLFEADAEVKHLTTEGAGEGPEYHPDLGLHTSLGHEYR